MTVEEEAAKAAEFKVELTDDIREEVKKSVLDANADKLESDLKAEIEAAESARLAQLQEEHKDYIAAYKEVSAANEGKSEEEVVALVQAKLSEGAGTGDAEEGLDLSFFGEEQAPAGEQKQDPKVEIPEDVKAKLQEYDEISSDPVLSAYVAAKKAGEVGSFIDKLKKSGALIDVSTIPAVDIFRAKLIEKKSFMPSLTDEIINEKVEEFSYKDAFTQELEIESDRVRLKQQQEEAMKSIAGSTKVDAQAASKARAEAMQALVSEASKFKGKEYLGLKLEDAHVSKAVKAAQDGILSFKKQDGSIDHEAAAKASILLSNYREILDSVYKKGQRDANKKSQMRNGNSKSPLRISQGLVEHKTVPSNIAYERTKAEAKKLGISVADYINSQGK